MPESVDYQFHAERLLENPAWRKTFEDARAELEQQRERMDLHDREARWALSVYQTALADIAERVERMSRGNVAVRLYHERMARTVA